MVERQKTEHGVVGGERRAVLAEQLVDVRDQVVVREHDALGQSRGAAGVGESGDCFLRALAGFGKLGGRRAEQCSEVFAAALGGGATCSENAAQIGKSGEIYVFEKRSIADEEGGAGILQLIADFAFAVSRVEQSGNGSGESR